MGKGSIPQLSLAMALAEWLVRYGGGYMEGGVSPSNILQDILATRVTVWALGSFKECAPSTKGGYSAGGELFEKFHT